MNTLVSNKEEPCRIVAVNGITQLISAIAALNEHLQAVSGADSLRNVLAINSLEIGNTKRAECMAQIIRQCAPLLQKWDAIFDFSELAVLPDLRLASPHEIFVNLLEVPENKRLFKLWPTAKRVLYGDGLGVNAALKDFLPDPTLSTRLRRVLAWFIPSIQVPYDMPMKEPCDYGYFLIDDPDSTVKSAVTRVLEPKKYRALFERLALGLDSSSLDQCIKNIPSVPDCDVLLMTNLYHPPITNRNAEIAGYIDLLTQQNRQRPQTIIVKTHPRHHSDLLNMIEAALQPLYKTVFMIKDHDVAVLPFEVLLLRAFKSGTLNPSTCNIFATSTAAYSAPVVFGKPVQIGFGKKMCRNIFPTAEWRTSRLRHESKLQANVTALLLKNQSQSGPDNLNWAATN